MGRPLGVGFIGAEELAREMHADSFRFLGWNGIPAPVYDACGTQKVDIEFVDTKTKTVSPISFTYEGGRIVDASGWLLPFEAGPVDQGPDFYAR